MKPIGHLRSVFQFKNGTPRQPSLCSAARGSLTVDKGVFNNPEHALEGLEQFSHAWIVFLFHKNQPGHSKAKVKPPRLNGKRVGVFSTRSPYRPNAIGLTLAKIEKISGATVFFSGIDIIDGTPVLDIKPFIPQYDVPECRGEFLIEDNPSATTKDYTGENLPPLNSGNRECCAACGGADDMDSDTVDMEPVMNDSLVSSVHQENSDAVSASHCEDMKTSLRSSDDMVTSVKSSDIVVTSLASSRDVVTLSTVPETIFLSHGDSGENMFDHTGEMTRELGSVGSASVTSQESCLPLCLKDEVHESVVNKGEKNTVRNCVGSTISHKDEQYETVGSCHCQYEDRDTSVCVVKGNRSTTKQGQALTHLSVTHTKISNSAASNTSVAQWLSAPPVNKLHVSFTPTAETQLQKFMLCNASNADPIYRLDFLSGLEDVRSAIVSVLAEDPRSVYRREKCGDSLYFFTVDRVHVTCWFDDKGSRAEVVRLQPVSFVEKLHGKEI